jgi:tetratricopeptide (TPR) repeat protein
MKGPAALLLLALAACGPSVRPEEDYNLALSSPDPAQALTHLDRAIAARPLPEYFTERARIRLALQQRSEALADYTSALERTPADELGSAPRARLLLRRALLLAALGRVAQADADLSEALTLAPEYTEARLERARLRRRTGRAEEADRDIEAARRGGIAPADFFYNEAVRAIGIGERAEAERMLDLALDLDPGHSRAHVARARLAMEQGRFEEAAKELDRAIPVHPGEADLYYYRGTALLAVGRAEAALRDFEAATRLDPNEPRYLAARGLAKFRSGQDIAAAREDFEAAIHADDSCYAAWFNRGIVAYERKEFEDAEKDLRHAVGLHASPEGSIALARVLQERGSVDAALDLLQRSLQIYPAPDAQRALREEADRIRSAKENKP